MKLAGIAISTVVAAVFVVQPAGIRAAHVARGSAASVHCPAALSPGPNAPEGALAAVRREIPSRYPGSVHRDYRITLLISLAGNDYLTLSKDNRVLRQIAVSQCGKRTADRSWLVFLVFPHAAPSESMYSGQLYVARTASGWGVWFQFH